MIKYWLGSGILILAAFFIGRASIIHETECAVELQQNESLWTKVSELENEEYQKKLDIRRQIDIDIWNELKSLKRQINEIKRTENN